MMPATTPHALLASAAWITTPAPAPPAGQRPGYEFRRVFTLLEPPTSAELIATAHGVYEAFVNGERVGDLELTPGITSYRKTLQVQRYDVTALLRQGENELVLVVSDGWFRGRVGAHRVPDSFGTEIAVIASLTSVASTGTTRLTTDTTWQTGVGAIVAADLMDGQVTDFRRTGLIDYRPAIIAADPLTLDDSRLTWSPSPPARVKERYSPASITRLPSGRQIVDFGQNLNGRVRLTRLGPAGTPILLTHGEALDHRGDLTQSHLDITIAPGHPPLSLGQVDTAISRGDPDDAFEPRHTTHGFRFVAVDGLAEDLTAADITAHQVRTDLAHIGTFASSHQQLNELHRIAVASWRANTLDIPTDCPQRERWGYTGDFQIFARSATYLDDITGFARKWLTSLADDQHDDGKITNVAPDCGMEPEPIYPISFDGSAGWGDAATIVPSELYRSYGNVEMLAEFLPMMRRWVDYAAAIAETGRHATRTAASADPAPHERYIWDTGWHWGEWLEPDTPFNPQADPAIVATAYLAHSARLTARAADAIGEAAAAERYSRLADDVTAAWRTEFLRPDGTLTVPTQANYCRALAFDLIPDDLTPTTADHLVRLIEENGTFLATGFLSTGLLLPTLADHGYADVAYNLLFQTEEPGWLIMLERGATTVWEAWNGIDADGAPHESLNHYSKGAVVTFLHEYVAGIRPTSPGYETVEIRPHLDPRLTWAEGTLQTRHGLIRSRWEADRDVISVDVRTPDAVTGFITMPDGSRHELSGGAQSFTCQPPAPRTRTPYPDRRAERARVAAPIGPDARAALTWGRVDPLTSTLGELLDDPEARHVFDTVVPGLTENPMIDVARPIPLETVLKMAAPGIPEQALRALRERLAAL
jgi:alpha-L-rhamnosidase